MGKLRDSPPDYPYPVKGVRTVSTLFRVLVDVSHLFKYMYGTLGLAFALSAIDLTTPLVVRRWLFVMTGEGGEGQDRTFSIPFVILCLAGFIILLHAVRALLTTVNFYVAHRLGWGGVCHMRKIAFDHMQKLSPGYFENRQTGELASRIITDLFDVEPLLAHTIPQLVTSVTTFAGVGVILLFLNWRLAIIALFPIPVFLFFTRRFHRRSRMAYRKLRHRQGQLSQISQETLSGMPTVQSFTLEETQSEKFDSTNTRFHNRAMITAMIAGTYMPLVDMIVRFGNVLVIMFGGILVMQGGLSFADLVVFIMYIGGFFSAAQTINNIGEPLQRCLTGLARVYDVMDTPPQITEKPKAIAPPDIAPVVELQDVYFAYNENAAAIQGVTLTAPPGKTLALVGPSGGGKTTITRLVCRFYDPDRGSVRIGGYDVRDLKLAYVRSLVSLVSQDVFLFSASIRENIRYGRPDATDEEIEDAARQANAHDFITSTDHGYNTQVGERGIRLSGGQKQRLSIARAILKDAPVLILDEATSSVDVESEALIQEAMGRLCENRTTIVIAHRLSTVVHADNIAVIDRGRLVEFGTHDELLDSDGLYARLTRQSAVLA